jgi:GDSL-like lipase/acylhydrolase family protein
MSQMLKASSNFGSLAATAVLLGLSVCPLPAGWARSARDSARSPEMNRIDREANAGGYYEGLIGSTNTPEGMRGELALRLLGKPNDWIRFHDAGVANFLPGDFLQFELKPDLNRPLFGQAFTTNHYGMRDGPYALEKAPGVFRIALLGSSMDMGWGVGTSDTYENRLENWLNAHAAKRGLKRRFEVLNFAMAAYGPAQRVESFRRKALKFQPDLVVYSVTMLDPRLTEIHLCDLLQRGSNLGFDFMRQAVAEAKLTASDLKKNSRDEFVNKDALKTKLRPQYWPIADASLGALVAQCHSAGLPLVCVIIPRVGRADAPDARAEAIARHREIAAHHGVPVIDLSGTFDDKDPAEIEIAAWDDHPNVLGHRLLFLGLAKALVKMPGLYETVFGVPVEPQHAEPQTANGRP